MGNALAAYVKVQEEQHLRRLPADKPLRRHHPATVGSPAALSADTAAGGGRHAAVGRARGCDGAALVWGLRFCPTPGDLYQRHFPRDPCFQN